MNPLREAPNLNALHGALIIEELVRLGVRRFFLSPGSRSSPLVVAAARHDQAAVTIRIDERGAGFHALGAARGSGVPTVVITTSGTAVANLYPAVVEASMDDVPLILLTADRPPELHGVGANQAIPQEAMFGAFCRSSLNLDPPSEAYAPLGTLRAVDEGFAAATGPRAGPVQINVQLREPLAPTPSAWDPTILDPVEDWLEGDQSLQGPAMAEAPTPAIEQDVATAIKNAKRGLLVLGTLGPAAHEAAASLAGELGWAVYADVRSGYRLGTPAPSFLPHLDWVLEQVDEDTTPDVILQVGGRLTSKRMQQFLQRGLPEHYILIDDGALGADPAHNVTRHIPLDPAGAIHAVHEMLDDRDGGSAPVPWVAGNRKVEELLDAALGRPHALSEPFVARHVSERVDLDHALFVSSSMPIRDMQSFASSTGPRVPLGANRGASGIDGVVSSAIGFAEGLGSPTTLVIGDLALLHDLNGLGCLAHAEQPLTIVVVNNGGGGIFAFLPIAEHEELFDPYFKTPHDLTFEHVANAFGLRYFSAATPNELEEGYRTAVAFGERALIEVRSGVMENKHRHDEIEAAIRATLGAGAP